MNSDNIRYWLSGGRKRHVLELYDLVRPNTFDGLSKLRVGNHRQDGGYVMADDFVGIRAALSLGIGRDISWDTEMTKRGIEVYQFDHTVAEPLEVEANPRLHFYPAGIAAVSNSVIPMRSLEDVLAGEMAAHHGDLILKIDIDGYEWEVFGSISDAVMVRFRQICIEIHHPLARPSQPVLRERNLSILKRIHDKFAPVHLHANNAGPIRHYAGLRVPKLLEITYIRRDGQQFRKSDESFPGEFDMPNVPDWPEIPIGDIVGLR
jgi:hypothetical protein